MPPIVLVLNGPNLNLLGTREPATYGHETLADISALCGRAADEFGLAVEFRQTNQESELLDWIHGARAGAPVSSSTRRPGPTLPWRSATPWWPAKCRSSKSTCPTFMPVKPSATTPLSHPSPLA